MVLLCLCDPKGLMLHLRFWDLHKGVYLWIIVGLPVRGTEARNYLFCHLDDIIPLWLKFISYQFYYFIFFQPDLEMIICCSVPFSHSVVSDSLRPHEPQHTRPPCPSPTPRIHKTPCPLSWWCHSTISSSVIPLSSCPQSFLASGSFQMSQLNKNLG